MLQAIYTDRIEAGRKLAHALVTRGLRHIDLVLGLARGGVPVANEVARALGAELDVMIVRKLGVPGHEELAMGALAQGGVRVLNERVVEALAIDMTTIEEAAAREEIELNRRARYLRGTLEPVSVENRVVAIVDDGIATGSTMKAAVRAVRKGKPRELVVAVPVAPHSVVPELAGEVEHLVIDAFPEPFFAVGTWYYVFREVPDEEVRRLLVRFRAERKRRALEARP